MGRTALADECSNGSFDSTFALIQKAIFENHSCNADVCHGSAKSGGLDLRPDAAYDNLIDVEAMTVAGFRRVIPGDKDDSLLFVNLAAKAEPDMWKAPLRAMPLDPLPGLSHDELEAVRLWIEKGAPRTGVVDGTGALLNACLPPPEPITITPLPAPPAGTGIQLQMPPWTLNAHSEREICFASYYDVTEHVPEHLRRDDGTFRYKLQETRQAPLSHHMVPILYRGMATIDSASWGQWTCHGGAQA
ncbi:MAG TPA: hypothetical protein VMT89_13030, partial [Candidatus Acidoferrales bacterium]|nr:hypothetical protein [Candidatus Acidoferrales bacterium]